MASWRSWNRMICGHLGCSCQHLLTVLHVGINVTAMRVLRTWSVLQAYSRLYWKFTSQSCTQSVRQKPTHSSQSQRMWKLIRLPVYAIFDTTILHVIVSRVLRSVKHTIQWRMSLMLYMGTGRRYWWWTSISGTREPRHHIPSPISPSSLKGDP